MLIVRPLVQNIYSVNAIENVKLYMEEVLSKSKRIFNRWNYEVTLKSAQGHLIKWTAKQKVHLQTR